MNQDKFYDSEEWNMPGKEHFETIRAKCIFKDPDNIKFCLHPAATGMCYCVAKDCLIMREGAGKC